MILLGALILGLLAGLAGAALQGRPYQPLYPRHLWLIPAAFAPQLLVAYLPATRELLPYWLAAAVLPSSLLVFLVFAWVNRGVPGMPLLLAGLVLNLLVIAANGGWMPISPETASHLPGAGVLDAARLGTRFGQKDILLLTEDTRLAFLSDRFLLPSWFHYAVALSLGDILVAGGVFWLLARPARANPTTE
ncbi:MAG: DUF5317 domain-containing protein [Chloroflexota bacterium]